MLLGQPYVNAMWCCLSHVTGVCKWDGDTEARLHVRQAGIQTGKQTQRLETIQRGLS